MYKCIYILLLLLSLLLLLFPQIMFCFATISVREKSIN